jgi:hypothetical protein
MNQVMQPVGDLIHPEGDHPLIVTLKSVEGRVGKQQSPSNQVVDSRRRRSKIGKQTSEGRIGFIRFQRGLRQKDDGIL